MNTTGDKGESEDGKSELAMNENMATSTVSMNTTSTASPFQQHPPPSPLSGCYLLVVLPEPHTAQHKDLILNRLAKGFLSWDKDSCHVDLTKELQALVAQSPEGEEARNGERLIQYATENLVTEILIHPQTNTLLQCIRNLLASFTKHRHIIHAGYTFNENGSWILQDGTFSLADFLDAFNEHDVQRVLRAYENSVSIDINCANIGDWSGQRLTKDPSTRSCRIRLNPDDILTAGMPAITNFKNYISQYLVAQALDELMRPSDVVGNIRFSHPTLYVFPGGQGDAALFGINGFNMLVDGGFARKSCFWDFTRHLDRLDAVLFTRLNNSNIGGMSSVLQKKKEMNVYPQIGHFFCNLVERKHVNSPDGDKDLDPLVLSLIDLGQEMMINLRHINLRPHPCYRNYEPINLYHKVGHGTLDMYVLSPTKDSREVKDFLTKWNSTDWKLFAGSHKKDTNNMVFPIQNLISICALLIWQPANPDDTITRILFPGSTPQHKIFEGLQRLNHLEFLKHPTCTAKSISPSTSLISIKDKSIKQKLGINDKETKRMVEVKKQKRETVDVKKIDNQHQQQQHQQPPIIKTKKVSALENKRLDELKDYPKVIVDTKKSEKVVKETKKESKKDVSKNDKEMEIKKYDIIKPKTDSEKTAISRISKNKMEQKRKDLKEIPKLALKSPKTDLKSENSVEQTVKMSTPKKIINASAPKTEVSKVMTSKVTHKSTVKTTIPPAKSAKDANNRKVVEQKNIEKMSMAGYNNSSKSTLKSKSAATPAQNEKKSVTRQSKTTTSPGKNRITGSPAKSGKPVSISVKSEKEQKIKKNKSEKCAGDTTSVPTSSVIEIDTLKYADKNLTEKSEDMSFDSIESKVLADLKEEREVVEEIEAVLKKAERKESVAAGTEFEGGAEEETTEGNNRKEDDMTEDDVTADIDDVPRKAIRDTSHEITEEDEYLIIEKEENYTTNLAHTPAIKHQDILDTTDMEKNKFVQPIEKEEANDRAKAEQAPEEEQEEDDGDNDDDDDDDNDDDDDDDDDDDNVGVDDDNDDEDDEQDEDEEVEVEVEIDEDEDEEKVNIHNVGKEKDNNVKEDESGDDGIEKDVEKGILEEREKSDPEKYIHAKSEMEIKDIAHDKYNMGITEYKEQLEQEMKGIITSAAEIIEKTGNENEIGKKDREDVTKESPSLTTEQLGSSEKKTIDTDVKPDIDLKEPCQREKLEESQERISTIESGATTTAPTLPEDERIPAETFNRHSVEKQMIMEDVRRVENVGKAKIIPLTAEIIEGKSDAKIFGTRQSIQTLPRDIVKTPDEVADLPVHEEVDPKLYEMSEFDKSKEEKLPEHKDTKGQKRVFGFFGKVADKIEKGMDKLTGKSARDLEKDIDEKSSSKSTSPKETNDIVNAVAEIKSKTEKDIDHQEIKKEIQKISYEIEPKKSTKEHEISSLGDIEDVEALLEEASKKFKSVKDSLRDSLESFEEPIIAEEFQRTESVPPGEGDEIKETLDEVAEKLEEIKCVSPKTDEIEKKDIEEQICSLKDVKEAMRDVGEVLAGTAGIVIESPPKDVVEIVKKVAEVLKEDDFLSEKTLFSDELTVTNQQEKQSIKEECDEPTCIKHVIDSKMYQDNASNVEIKPSLTDVTESDDKDDGIKHILKKDDVQQTCFDNKEQRAGIKTSEITFDQKSQPATAELVVVTPDSLPPSPELVEENLQDETEENIDDLNQIDIHVPTNVKDVIQKTEDINEVIEKLILVDKIKITIVIFEYIVNIKHMPRQKVISVIKDIINHNKVATNIVDTEILDMELSESSVDKESEIEEYINDQYIKKSIKITHSILDDIAVKKSTSVSIVVKIIEEIIRKKHITLDDVMHVTADELQTMIEAEEEKLEDKITKQIDGSHQNKEKTQEISDPTFDELQSYLENEFMTEYINKGLKITDVAINDICQGGFIPDRVVIKIIDEMITKKMLLKEEIDISTSLWNVLESSDTVEVDEKETMYLKDTNLVHDFVIIPSKDSCDNNRIIEQKGNEIDMAVSDDFEAVEQEYKSGIVSDECKARIEVEEAMEDDINDVEEADDKIVRPTSEKTIGPAGKIALADEAIEVNKEAIVKHEHSTKLLEKKEDLIPEEEMRLVNLLTAEKEIVTSVGDDRLNRVKRLMVTATSDDGCEEIALCTTDNINDTKSSISDNLLSSPVKSTSEQESVCSRISTPEIDNASSAASPPIKLFKDTFEDDDINRINTTKDISSPAKEKDHVSMVDTVGEIKEDENHKIHEIQDKPSDILKSEHVSPVESVAPMSPTVNEPEETKESLEHDLIPAVGSKINDLTLIDDSQVVPEKEPISSRKQSSDHEKLQHELDAIGDRTISISTFSITQNEKNIKCEDKSLSSAADSTANLKDSLITHSKTTPTDQSPEIIEEHLAETIEAEKKSPTLNKEDSKPSDSSTDNSIIRNESFGHVSPQAKDIKLTDEIASKLCRDDVKSTSTIIYEISESKKEGFPNESIVISGKSSDELKCNIKDEKDPGKVLSHFSTEKDESHIPSDSIHPTKLDSITKETEDKLVKDEDQISVISQRTENDTKDNNETCQETLVEPTPSLSKGTSPTLSEQDDDIEDPKNKVHEDSVKSNIDEITTATTSLIITTPTQEKIIDDQSAISNIDDNIPSSPISQPSSFVESVTVETKKPQSIIADLKNLILHKPDDPEIVTKVMDTTHKSSSDEDNLPLKSPVHQSDKSDVSDVTCVLHSQTPQEILATETGKEVDTVMSESYSDDQNKSTVSSSIHQLSTNTNIIIDKKEKSPSPIDDLSSPTSMKIDNGEMDECIIEEKSISRISNQNKLPEQSPVSQPTSPNKNVIDEQEKLHDTTPSFHSPQNMEKNLDNEIIDDKSTNDSINQLKTIAPSTTLQSPDYKKNIISEVDKSPSPTQELQNVSPSSIDKNEMDKKVIDEILISPSSDQIKSPVSLSISQPTAYDDNVIVEREKADITHDLHSPKKIEDTTEKITEEIPDTKSISHSTDQNESPIVSPISQPKISEGSIIHAKEKLPSPTHKFPGLITDESDSMEIQKTTIDVSSTSHDEHQIEPKLSPTTQSSSRKESIVIESDVSSSLTQQLSPQTSNKADSGETDDKEIGKQPIISSASSISPQCHSLNEDKSVITEPEKSLNLTHDVFTPISSSSNDKEMNEKLIDKTTTYPSVGEVEATLSSSITPALDRKESIVSEDNKPSSLVRQLPSPTLSMPDNGEINEQGVVDKFIIPGVDHSKSPVSSLKFQSSSPDKSAIFEIKELPPTTVDYHTVKSSNIEDMGINENITQTKLTPHSTSSHESSVASSVHQSPIHEKSINDETDKSPIVHHSTLVPSNTHDTQITKEINDKKSIIPIADKNISPVPSVASLSPSHDQSIDNQKEKLPSPIHELFSATADKTDEKDIKKQIIDDEFNLDNENKLPVSSLSPCHEKNIIGDKQKSPNLIQEKRHSIVSITDDIEVKKEMIDKDTTSGSVNQFIVPLSCKSEFSSTSPQSSSRKGSLIFQKEELAFQQVGLISNQTEEIKTSKHLDCSQISSKTSDGNLKSSISPVETSSDMMKGTTISSRDKSPDLSLSISLEVQETNAHPSIFLSKKHSLVGAKDNDDDMEPPTVPHAIACTVREDVLTDNNKDDDIQKRILPLSHSTSPIQKESVVDITDKIAIDIKSITSPPLSHSTSPICQESVVDIIDKSAIDDKPETSPSLSHPTSPIRKESIVDITDKSAIDVKPATSPSLSHSTSPIRKESVVSITDKSAIDSKSAISPSLSHSTSPIRKESVVDITDKSAIDSKSAISPSLSHSTSPIRKESVVDITDKSAIDSKSAISPSLSHSTSPIRKESVVDITDKSAIDSKSAISPLSNTEYSGTGAINNESLSSTTAETLSSGVSTETIVHENEPSLLKSTEFSTHHIEETYDNDPIVNIKYSEDCLKKIKADSVIDKDEPLQDRSRSHSLFETDVRTPVTRSRAASLFSDKEEIVMESMSKTDDDEDDNLKPTQVSAKDDMDLTDISFVKRMDIEDYITEMFIKPKKKISMKLLIEMAELKQVTINIIIVIIKYFIAEKNISIESLVDEELSSRIQKELVFKVEKVIEKRSDEKNNVKEEKMKRIESFDITEKSFITEEKKLEIEKYVMENYINKGKTISSLVLNDMEQIMAVPRYVLLEIIIEITKRLKLTQESIYDKVIDSEIQCKIGAKEYISGKSTPERKSSGYSTPEVKDYNEKFQSQFHKAFVDGMTEIRTTHITTLSGKSTPDVSTHANYSESEQSGTIATASEISQSGTHVIKEQSGPTAVKHTIISSTGDSPECKTIIKRTIIEQEIFDKDNDVIAHQMKEIAKDTIHGKDTDDEYDQHEVKNAVATPARHDYMGSLISDNKSGRSTPDKFKDISDRPTSTTPEGFRAGEIIKTTITTTRTVSEEGEIITTTKEVTETTNEKGETTVMTEKVDVTVADRTLTETELPTIDTIKSLETDSQSIMPYSEVISLPTDQISSGHSSLITDEWTKEKEKQQKSDNEAVGDSPISVTSHVYHYEKHDDTLEFSAADMSSSFYGQLPNIPPSRTVDISIDAGSSDQTESDNFTFKKMTPDKRMDVKFSSKQHDELSDFNAEKTIQEKNDNDDDDDDDDGKGIDKRTDTTSSSSKDPLQEWGTPLKLPPPERPEKFNLRTSAITRNADISPDSLDFDVIHDWGEPMRLPSPTQIGVDDTTPNKIVSSTMKKDVKQPRKVISENLKNKKYLDSPIKSDKKLKESKNKIQPIYLDLTYVPHHGNSYYASLDFFKRIRARYYVFSGTEPSREVYDALLNAKKTWENKNLEVTIIPTYDTDTLGYWVADNEEALAANRIDLSPSASRCTINLQDHETSCSAYRLEF